MAWTAMIISFHPSSEERKRERERERQSKVSEI